LLLQNRKKQNHFPENNGDNRKTYSPQRNYNLEYTLAEMG